VTLRAVATKARSAGNVTPQPRAFYSGANTMTTPQKLGPWTDGENNIIASHYVDMLARELRGDKYNKAANRREGITLMAASRDDGNARSHGSWEMKCCNISAVMQLAGLPWINGLGHGQARPLAAALFRQMIAHGWSDRDITKMLKLYEKLAKVTT
jgi:hypothetical protein